MYKNNQKGISLPIVMFVTAMIAMNTYYFMTLNKNTSQRTALLSTQIKEEAERRKISSYLADFQVCNKNFATKVASTLTTPTPIPQYLIANDSSVFLRVNDSYMLGTYKLDKYYFEYAAPTLPLTAAKLKNAYTLILSYSLLSKAPGKKNALIKIPLNTDIDMATGKITRCYAKPLNDTSSSTKVDVAVDSACQGNSAYKKVDPNTGITTCEHIIAPVSCPTGKLVASYTLGLGTGTPNKTITYECSFLPNTTDCATVLPGAVPTIGTGITNNIINCASPDTGCAAGKAMIKSTATTFACTSNCGTSQVFNSYNNDGSANCYDRIKPCPSGQYTTAVAANGNVTCAPIRYLNADCGAGNYATDMNPTAGDPLTCASYSKVKACAPAGAWTFVTNMGTAAPGCTAFTN